MDNFSFTQTSIKDFEKSETCPYRWKKQWVDREIQFPSNLHMEKGKYFEQLFIGGSAKEDETTDLPRLQNGAKSVDQIRIEEQAQKARQLFDPNHDEFLGFTITDTQLKLKSKSTGREGTIDIVAKDTEQSIWVLDVKLTKDLNNTRTQYGWGNNWDDLDLLQQYHYESLYEEEYGVRPKMGLIVFDYSPSKRIDFREILIEDEKRLSKEIRFKSAEEAFELYSTQGWIRFPSENECSQCPLECNVRKALYKK